MSTIENSVPLQRAWVPQERTLSPRILHFIPQQLFWEYSTQEASEVYPLELNKTKGNAHFK
jgi:hypothetical protein